MGAGASADVAKKVEEASADDLKATVAGLSEGDRAKLLAALGGKKQSVRLPLIIASQSTALTSCPLDAALTCLSV